MKTKLLIFILLSISAVFSQTPTAVDIVDRVTNVMSPENTYSKGTQTIITSSGKERVFEFESWSAGKGESSLTR